MFIVIAGCTGDIAKRTRIQLTESQLFELKSLSAERHTSRADLIRQAVDSFLERAADIDREERKRRAVSAAGQFRSGLGDLATDGDRYLAGAYSDDDDLR